jgi:hypothetical protein
VDDAIRRVAIRQPIDRREIRSFWYPTWLAQPAALVPGSRLVDAPLPGDAGPAVQVEADGTAGVTVAARTGRILVAETS